MSLELSKKILTLDSEYRPENDKVYFFKNYVTVKDTYDLLRLAYLNTPLKKFFNFYRE